MELKRDEIISAMNFCRSEGHICGKCPYRKVRFGISCRDKLIRDALSLFNELTIELDAMRGAANSYKMHYEKLTEENERLRAEVIEEFATRLKTYYNHLNGGTYASLVSYHVDQVKNIMLGEVTTNGD